MTSTVSYSYTAVNTLRQCNRKYGFSNVLATFGRKSPLRRKAYELKNMQDIKMWKGSVVDKVMETIVIPAINDKKPLDFSAIAEQAVDLANRQFIFSRVKAYTDPFLNKTEVNDEFCILDIHEIGKPCTEVEIAEAFDTIRQAVLNIPIIQMPDGKLLIDFLKECNVLAPNVNDRAIEIETARVKPQIDLIAYHEWKPVIVDWKLSESYISDYERQLLISGIVIYLGRLQKTDKTPYAYNDIRLYEVNLLKSIVKAHEFTEEKVNELIDYINLTSADISLIMSDTINKHDIDDFELTDNEGLCRLCNYRTLCSYLLINKNSYDEKSYNQFVQGKQFV